MKMPRFASLVLSFAMIANSAPILAFETDQYNLPPVPLADISGEVTEYVFETLGQAVARVNANIERARACVNASSPRPKACGPAEDEQERLDLLLSDDAVAREYYDLVAGNNLLVTKFGKWIRAHKFKAQPSSYKTSYLDSIYVMAPADYLTISPTVKLYGVDLGIDKLEHILQQGYKYQRIRKKAERKGAKPAEAIKKAVAWGKKTERTYFGLLSSGVYSNADLAANYAGMKFYEGLTVPVTINGLDRPATLTLTDGQWRLNDNAEVRESLLKPLISEHLNEALNPSSYAIPLFPFVRHIAKKKACPEWRAQYPNLSRTDLNEKTRSLELWNGEDYGYTKKSRSLSLGDMCFGEPAGTRAVPVAAV